MSSTPEPRLRLDKWLWAARLYKSRTLAAQAIETGQARVNQERVKPSHPVHIGERVTVRKTGLEWTLHVLALSDRRGSAADARLLYREEPESIALREMEIAQRKAAAASAPQWPGRPTKRQRRKLQDFLDEA